MRTTVDIDDAVLLRAKRHAEVRGATLGQVVTEALAAHLAARPRAPKEPPFELLVAGTSGARFPTPAEVAAEEDAEAIAALRIPRRRRRAAS